MANERDIKIQITTEADTSGAKEAEDSIKKVNEASAEGEGGVTGFGDNGRAASEARIRVRAAEAQAEAQKKITTAKKAESEATETLIEQEKELTKVKEQAFTVSEKDVENAKARQAAPGQENSGNDLAALGRASTYFAAISASVGAANALLSSFTSGLQDAGIDLDKLRETNPGDFIWIDTLKGLSNPLETIKTQLLEIGGLSALQDSAEQAARMEEALEKARVAAEKFAEVDNIIRLGNLEAERRAVDAVTASMQRQYELNLAIENLQETKAQIQDEQAISNGADPAAVAAAASARQNTAEIKKLNEELTIQLQDVAAAKLLVEQASREMERVLDETGGADNPAFQKAFDAQVKLRESAEELALNAENTRQIIEVKTEQGNAVVAAAFVEAGAAIEAKTAAATGELIEKITGAGGELDSLQKAAVADVEKILADGRVTEGEQEGLRAALSKLISTWSGDTQTLVAVTAEGNAITETLRTQVASLKQEQSRLRDRVNQLSGR